MERLPGHQRNRIVNADTLCRDKSSLRHEVVVSRVLARFSFPLRGDTNGRADVVRRKNPSLGEPCDPPVGSYPVDDLIAGFLSRFCRRLPFLIRIRRLFEFRKQLGSVTRHPLLSSPPRPRPENRCNASLEIRKERVRASAVSLFFLTRANSR